MYGGLPTSYNPRATSSAPASAGFKPELKAALAVKTAANSPWPLARPINVSKPGLARPLGDIEPAGLAITPRQKAAIEKAALWPSAPAPAGYDNSKPAGEHGESQAEAEARQEYLTAEAARIRADKKPADILAFAGRLEAKAVALRLEAAEASRLEALAAGQAGWLTAEAEARSGRASEALEAEAREATSARIAAEAREAVAAGEAAKTAEALELAREAVAIGEALAAREEFGQAEANSRAKLIADICESEKAEAKTAEAGERIKLTAILPADMRKPEHRSALAVLEFDLTMAFGGYTVSKARGGWLDGSGDIVRDSSQVYNCSFNPAERDSETAEAKIIAFYVTAGEALGEEWLHIERSIFTASHRKAAG